MTAEELKRLAEMLSDGDQGGIEPITPQARSLEPQRVTETFTPQTVTPPQTQELTERSGGGILSRLGQGLQQIGNDPAALRDIAQFGAAIAGEGSSAERIAAFGTQMFDRRQAAEYMSRLMSGEDVSSIESDPRMRGVPPEARQAALDEQARQREHGQRDRQLDVAEAGQRALQSYQEGQLSSAEAERALRREIQESNLTEAEKERALREGLGQLQAETQRRGQDTQMSIAQMQDATQRYINELRHAADGAGLAPINQGMDNMIKSHVLADAAREGHLQLGFDPLATLGAADRYSEIVSGRNVTPAQRAWIDRRYAELEFQVRTGQLIGGANLNPGEPTGPAAATGRREIQVSSREEAARAAQTEPPGTIIRLGDDVFEVMPREGQTEGGSTSPGGSPSAQPREEPRPAAPTTTSDAGTRRGIFNIPASANVEDLPSIREARREARQDREPSISDLQNQLTAAMLAGDDEEANRIGEEIARRLLG